MVIYDTECPYGDQVSLNNTNRIQAYNTQFLFKLQYPNFTFSQLSRIMMKVNGMNITKSSCVVFAPEFLSHVFQKLKVAVFYVVLHVIPMVH